MRARRRSRPTCRSRRDELGAAIDEAHKRGLKITGHLCSVTYAEAADLGIDNLEHGFLAATDFVADKQPDACPGQGRGQQTIAALDENGEPFKALVKKLIDKRVTLTSTLTVFETFTPGRPVPPGVDVLLPAAQGTVPADARAHGAQSAVDLHEALSQGARARAGVRQSRAALLIAGTDPTGGGGVIPGLRQPAAARAHGRGWIHPARSHQHRHLERREIPGSRRESGNDRRRQAGRSRRRERRPFGDIADVRRSRPCSSRASASIRRS